MSLYQQAIVNIQGQDVFGYELLLGHPKHTLGLAKDAGVLGNLEKYIFRVAEQLALKHVVFVNASSDFLNGELLDFQNESRINNIVLEITEKARVDQDRIAAYLSAFRNKGMRVALDDFGNGYNSFDRWALFKPDFVKIRWNENVRTEHIRTLLKFAESMGAQVIIEKVETKEQHNLALSLGVPFGQGFYYRRPSPISEEVKGNG